MVHRRSLSEDIGLIFFPPHTAPSDKARCHFVPSTTPLKHVGEAMAREDPYYKPFSSKANPFSALGQFKGVKILASTNSTDLFSSCFELPSPSLYKTETKNSLFDSSFDAVSSVSAPIMDKYTPFKNVSSDVWKRGPTESSASEPSIVIEPVIKPSHILKIKQQTSSNDSEKDLSQRLSSIVISSDTNVSDIKDVPSCSGANEKLTSSTVLSSVTNSVASDDEDRTLKPVSVFRVEPPRYYAGLKSKPLSLPSSPTFSRRKNTITVLSNDLFNRFTSSVNKPQLSKCSGDDETNRYGAAQRELRKKVSSLFSHPLFKNRSSAHQYDDLKRTTLLHPLRSCSSSSNLVTVDDIPGSPNGASSPFFNHSNIVQTIQGLKRRGSCESGFFSNIGEDFCLPGSVFGFLGYYLYQIIRLCVYCTVTFVRLLWFRFR